jgi:hypothetical protein
VAAANLQAAVEDLRPASRQRARNVGRKITKRDRQAAAEAARLKELIERKQREQAGESKAAAREISTRKAGGGAVLATG